MVLVQAMVPARVGRTGTGTGAVARGRGRGSRAWARGHGLPVCRRVAVTAQSVAGREAEAPANGVGPSSFTIACKFGGTSVASAERMVEVAELLTAEPEECPVVVLSAMSGITNALLAAGELATTSGFDTTMLNVPAGDDTPSAVAAATSSGELFNLIRAVHMQCCAELGVDAERCGVVALLDELGRLLTGISMLRECSPRTCDYLVSFGERLSTRVFAAYLNDTLGVPARQFDAWDIGFVSSDEFTNAEVDGATYENVAKALGQHDGSYMAILTGFIARGKETGAITTLGRGGSDLTATVVGAALRLREVQVWKDVDGVLTADPRLVKSAVPVSVLTFEEANELAFCGAKVLHPLSMRPAMKYDVPVKVRNSYNRTAPGTIIRRDLVAKGEDESDRPGRVLGLTSIVVKRNVTIVDLESTQMLGQYGFLAKVFSIFAEERVSVDVVATSEVSVSITLDQAKIWSRDLEKGELDALHKKLSAVSSHVSIKSHKAILSLIGDVSKSSQILQEIFDTFRAENINVQMMSQGASKVNISLVVEDNEAEKALVALHARFFEGTHA